MTDAVLILRDGEVFEGEAIGALDAGSVATGEVVFNTALSGYQEIVTDPSYAGQIITFTYPHIGNYGTNPDDDESRRPFCRGSWCASSRAGRAAGGPPSRSRTSSSATASPGSRASTPAASPGTCVTPGAVPGAFGTDEKLVRAAAGRPRRPTASTSPSSVTTDFTYTVGDPDAPFHVVAYDLGIKRTILRHLTGTRLLRRGGARRDDDRGGPRPQARWHLPLERPRRSGRGDRDDRRGSWARRQWRAAVRHLPRPSDPRSRARGSTVKLPVRPPRCEPPGPPRADRPGRDHEPEPQLRGRSPTRSARMSRSPTSTSTTGCAKG